MTNYEKFMKLLHDKGHVQAMNVAVNLSSIELLPDELKPLVIESSVAAVISNVIAKDPEIKQVFDRAACDLMLEKVVKDLDLKKDENFKPTAQDLFAKSFADAFINSIFMKNKD
jgi:hypothetical protein